MVSNEDRDTAIRRAAEAIQGSAYGKAAIEKASRAIDALIAHGWGPTAELRADRDQLTKALLTVLIDLHPVGGSTSRSGIGGQAMTTFCDIANPINVAADELREKAEGVLRRQLRRMEREGYGHDSVELPEVTYD